MNRITILTVAISAIIISCRRHGQVSIQQSATHITFKPGDEQKSIKAVKLHDQEYLSIYNKALKQIRIFEPDSLHDICISVPDSGLGYFRSFLVYSEDSIFLKYEYGIMIKNIRDSIIASYPHGGLIKANNERLVISEFDFYEPIMYYSKTHSIIHRVYPYDINYFELDFYKHPVFTSFSLRDGSYKCLKAYYPAGYNKNSYGGANHVYYALHNDEILMSFQISDDLYKYNLVTDEMSSVPGYLHEEPSKFDNRNSNDMSLVFEHLTSNNLSQQILIDPVSGHLIKFNWLKKEIVNKDGTFNSLNDKDLLMEIFTPEGKFIAQQNLGNKLNWFDAFFWKSHIYIGKKEPYKLQHKYEKIKLDIVY